MPVLVGVVGTVAVAAWCVAVWSAIEIVQHSPAGSRWRNYTLLGRFRFQPVRASAGAVVEQPIRRFQTAFLIFFAAILAGVLAGFAFAAVG